MKTLPVVSFLVVVVAVAVCISTCVTASSTDSIVSSEVKLVQTVFPGKSGNIESVNSTKEIKRINSENGHNNNKTEKDSSSNNNNNNTFTRAAAMIPTWIATQVASSQPPPPLIRARTTKLLEKPLESQLISQFVEPKRNTDEADSYYQNNFLSAVVTPSTSSTPLSPQSSFEKRHGLVQRRRKYSPDLIAATSSASFIKDPTVVPVSIVSTTTSTKNKRQDSEIPEFEGSPASEIEFTSLVSPLESSLGGLTGLQGLPPLSPVQFVKLLVAVTPFIIPLIFIPLLIFTIGLLMIPVTRQNVFVGAGDVRSPSSTVASSSLIPSFISSYVVNPLKTFSDGGSGGGTLMALPRSIGYDLGTKLMDTEQCVERISCEISTRYLHSHWEQGNWRSIANTSWISRIMGYLGKKYSTVSRIAKSLQLGDGKRIMAQDGGEASKDGKENDKQLQEHGSSSSSNSSTVISGFSRKTRSVTKNSSKEMCSRYTCQPKSLLRKFLASHSTKSS